MTQPTKQQILNAINALQARLSFTAICADNLGSVIGGTSSSEENVYNRFNDMVNSCSDNEVFVPLQPSKQLDDYASSLNELNDALQIYNSIRSGKSFSNDDLVNWATDAFPIVNKFYTFLGDWKGSLIEACETAPDA